MILKNWLQRHECARRALRTFVQTAVGVVVAAIVNAAGVVEDIDLSAVIALAVATGLAAVMNRTKEEERDDDGSDENGSNEDRV